MNMRSYLGQLDGTSQIPKLILAFTWACCTCDQNLMRTLCKAPSREAIRGVITRHHYSLHSVVNLKATRLRLWMAAGFRV